MRRRIPSPFPLRCGKGAIFLLALALVGCGSELKPVYVDLAQVPQADAPSATPSVALPMSAPAPGSGLSLDALPEQRLALDQNDERLKLTQASLERIRAAALKDYRTRLETESMAEIREWTKDELAKLGPERARATEAVFGTYRALFDAYAPAKGRIRLELANDVGFPDPDPDSLRAPDPEATDAWTAFQRAVDARKTLVTLDSMVDKTWAARLDAIDTRFAEAQAAIVRASAEREDAARKAAADEAQRLVQELDSDLGQAVKIDLGQAVKIDRVLEKAPAVAVKIAPTPRVAPSFPGPREPARPADSRRAQLEIWARVRGYRLVPRGQGRNATQEFLQWRQSFAPGP